MAERDLCKQVDAVLDATPRCWYFNVKDIFTAGLPDRIGCLEGQFFAIELKDVGKKPTKLQLWVLKKIEDAGGQTLWTDDIETVKKFIARLRVHEARLRGRIV